MRLHHFLFEAGLLERWGGLALLSRLPAVTPRPGASYAEITISVYFGINSSKISISCRYGTGPCNQWMR
jgi:hypothetical protein